MCTRQATARGESDRAHRRGPQQRKGNIIVLTAFLMIVLMAMLAFAVDVGYICTMQAQLKRSVDAAALAGAGDLVESVEQAQVTATEYLVRNPVGSSVSVIDESALSGAIIEFETNHSDDLDMKVGNWNPVTRQFEETTVMPSSLSVTMTYPSLPTFFGRVLGRNSFAISASSTAQFQPRDIVVVLDYSASMNDDSTFASIGKLSQSVVESSLQNCWNDLGPPTYGNLTFTPKWAVAQGVAQNVAQQIPHVTVEYRRTSVYVTSTQNLSQVKIEFNNGAVQTWTPSGTKTGTYSGSGGNSGQQVRKVWVKSWSNHIPFGSNGEYFNFTSSGINTTLKNALGLNSLTYPYAGAGSWDGYIDHVESSGETNATAGYRYKFGGMNLVEYWLTNYPSYAKIPDLWKTRHEPQYALKDSMSVFMDFIAEVDTNDRVALVIYDAPDGDAILESDFTNDLDVIKNIVDHRQAGHYHDYTNIGAGMQLGRETMDASARPNATKLIVVMTDGLANWHDGQYDLDAAAAHIASESALCAAEPREYKIMSISVGVGADTSTMQSVADTTGGKHYNVPGGSTHQAMHDQLSDAFEEIAKARPLQLVK